MTGRVFTLGAGLAVAISAGAGTAGANVLTKAQYIARADAICRTEAELLAPYAHRYGRLTSAHRVNYAQAAVLLTESDAVRSASLVKLRALPVPAGSRTQLTAIWDTFDRLITETDEIAVAMGGSEVSAMAGLDSSAELTGGRYELMAGAFGFKACGAERN